MYALTYVATFSVDLKPHCGTAHMHIRMYMIPLWTGKQYNIHTTGYEQIRI